MWNIADMGFVQFEETNLVGVERGILLNERFEVVVDLFGVEADDPADGEGEVLRLVRLGVATSNRAFKPLLRKRVLIPPPRLFARDAFAAGDG